MRHKAPYALWLSLLILFLAGCGPGAEEAPKTPTVSPIPRVTATPTPRRTPTPATPLARTATPAILTPTPTRTPLVSPTPGSTQVPTPTPEAGAMTWAQVNDFLIQLQNLDLEAIGRTRYDLVIIDYSSDGTAAGEFSAEDIAALKGQLFRGRASPGGPKLVLAYLSIGEAEDYRYYWRQEWEASPPEWLDAENPVWPGNYKVKYWSPEWQGILFGSPQSYLDKIIAAGFDGVYLDRVDAYQYFAEARPSAEEEMAALVVAIAEYARATKGVPDFGVMAQNGEGLYSYPEYMAAITGIGREGIYYGYTEDNRATPPEVRRFLERQLDRFLAAGKLALTIDYTIRPFQIDEAYQRAKSRGYVPLATFRELDQLTINPGHEPD